MTRLISRTGHERQTVQTIRVPATPTGSHTTAFSNQNADPSNVADTEDQLRMAEMLTSNTSLPLSTADSTDELVRSSLLMQSKLEANEIQLHDFWNPMMLQDIFGNTGDQPMVSKI